MDPKLKELIRRREAVQLTDWEAELVEAIKQETNRGNLDNISRTMLYERFYKRHPEMRWSYLASFVSRNGGYNMSDLEGAFFTKAIEKERRKLLFLTYERANWLIFSDAYPQLLLYEASKRLEKPLFHLLQEFGVSVFMEREWERYWRSRDGGRLVTALIINEQNVIQKPVIEHPVYRRKVFRTMLFNLEDWFHFSSVLFPTVDGELFGFSVHGFRKLDNRITLGKRLAWLLFHPDYHSRFRQFTDNTPHTGSRYDYERYMNPKRKRDTPFIRTTFPIIIHHRPPFDEWFTSNTKTKKWFKKEKIPDTFHITDWYKKKREQLKKGIALQNLLMDRSLY